MVEAQLYLSNWINMINCWWDCSLEWIIGAGLTYLAELCVCFTITLNFDCHKLWSFQVCSNHRLIQHFSQSAGRVIGSWWNCKRKKNHDVFLIDDEFWTLKITFDVHHKHCIFILGGCHRLWDVTVEPIHCNWKNHLIKSLRI